jgi:hypothetical protein
MAINGSLGPSTIVFYTISIEMHLEEQTDGVHDATFGSKDDETRMERFSD